jgi:hypothetical protein
LKNAGPDGAVSRRMPRTPGRRRVGTRAPGTANTYHSSFLYRRTKNIHFILVNILGYMSKTPEKIWEMIVLKCAKCDTLALGLVMHCVGRKIQIFCIIIGRVTGIAETIYHDNVY